MIGAVARGLERNFNVAVTASTHSRDFWQQLAADAGAEFRTHTVDPGRETVMRRAETMAAAHGRADIQEACIVAIKKWYGSRRR